MHRKGEEFRTIWLKPDDAVGAELMKLTRRQIALAEERADKAIPRAPLDEDTALFELTDLGAEFVVGGEVSFDMVGVCKDFAVFALYLASKFKNRSHFSDDSRSRISPMSAKSRRRSTAAVISVGSKA